MTLTALAIILATVVSFMVMVGICLIVKIWRSDWPDYQKDKYEVKK